MLLTAFIKILKYLIQNLDIKSSKENEEENSKELTVEEEIEKTKLLIKTIWDMKKETLRDVEGLEPLETSMKLLSKMAEFLDVKFLTYDLSEVTQILFKTTSHPNKYVRETSFNIIELLFKIADNEIKRVKPNFLNSDTHSFQQLQLVLQITGAMSEMQLLWLHTHIALLQIQSKRSKRDMKKNCLLHYDWADITSLKELRTSLLKSGK